MLDKDFRRDAEIWLIFLQNLSLHHICRPFTDLNAFEYASELQFFTDAAKSQKFGMGAVFGDNWMVARWGDTFIKEQDPSIEYLELFALVAGVLVWSDRLRDSRFIIFCDNQAVLGMVNSMTSKCHQCMKLLCILAVNGIFYNRRILVKYIASKSNILADSLSRMRFDIFWKHAPPSMNSKLDRLPEEIWPVERIWFQN